VATINVAVAEGNETIQEVVFTGTHRNIPPARRSRHSPDGEEGGNPLYAGPHLPRRQVVKLPAYLRPCGAHDTIGAHADLASINRPIPVGRFQSDSCTKSFPG
jgi:hypothetical protein